MLAFLIDYVPILVIYGIGGLAIPLVLLFTWLRRSRKARAA